MDIEVEIDKIISAVSKLSDKEVYVYPIPEEWSKYLSKVHIQRPYGMAIWDGQGRVIICREIFSPKRMRKVLCRVMKRADAHDASMSHIDYSAGKNRVWSKLWESETR